MKDKQEPIYNILNTLGQLVVASILWTVCSLPIFTIGASSTALYYSVVKVIRRENGTLVKSFFSSFRTNFWQSTKIHLLCLWLLSIPVCLALPDLLEAENGISTVSYIMIGLIVLGLLFIVMVYPTISRFYHTGWNLFRFVLLLIGRYPHAAVGSVALLAVGAVIAASNGASLLFIPGVAAYLQSLMLEPIFKKHSDSKDSEMYAMWYG